MIFASFGNSLQSMARVAKVLDDFARTCEEEVIVQTGNTDYDYGYCHSVGFMDKETFFRYLKECSVAVLHGGWGSISEASDMGIRIVAVPRKNGMEVHHDQSQLVMALEKQSVCIGCYDEKDLPELIEKARTFDFKPIKRGSAAKEINEFLRSF